MGGLIELITVCKQGAQPSCTWDRGKGRVRWVYALLSRDTARRDLDQSCRICFVKIAILWLLKLIPSRGRDRACIYKKWLWQSDRKESKGSSQQLTWNRGSRSVAISSSLKPAMPWKPDAYTMGKSHCGGREGQAVQEVRGEGAGGGVICLQRNLCKGCLV